LAKHGTLDIFNTDQGCQFTSEDFTNVLKVHGIQISMDGKGRWMDNVFIERLWRSLKYEEVYLHAYDSIPQAREGIRRWIVFYHQRRGFSSEPVPTFRQEPGWKKSLQNATLQPNQGKQGPMLWRIQ